MPNIILKDGQGVERTYPNKTSITVKNDQGGTTTFFSPEGKVDITDTQEVDVSQYSAAQVVDANLIPENIAEDVTVLGITGTFKGGGIEPTGNINITTTEQVDVTEYATAQVVAPDLTKWNVRNGASILGVSGKLQSPSFIVGNGSGAARLWYNKAFPWDDILPTLEYSPTALIGGIGGADDEILLIIALHVGDAYGVACGDDDGFIQVYATAPFRYEGEVSIDFPHAGWHGDYLQPPYPVMSSIMVGDIPDTLFASAEIAFGDWIKRPTETLRITQNGTYDVTGYAQVIVDIAGGGAADPTVEGKTLVFDDTTSVDGKTLVLGLDATVEGKTLVFGGTESIPADPTVNGKTLIFDDAASVDGKTLVLDAEASVSGKTLAFGTAEEEATVDGKDLVTSGSVDGKTAILDGRVEGKTLIL